MTTTLAPHPAELAELVEAYANYPAAWLKEVRFATRERWWTRLNTDGVTEVWLLTWDGRTATDLHDHGDSSGAFTVLSGRLEEVRVDIETAQTVTSQVNRGEVRTVDRGTLHDIRNSSHASAISLHAYSPPLREMTYYERPAGGSPRPALTVATDDRRSRSYR